MRLVIDLQGAQASNRLRGIGRYSLSLAKALVRNQNQNDVLIALNGEFSDSIEPIRSAFEGVLPQENIVVWNAVGPVNSSDPQNQPRRVASELIRESFLAGLDPDCILVSSMFEGFGDNAITSVGSLSRSVPTAVILYDLIPLIHRDIYLINPLMRSWYLSKLEHLKRADLLLSISASSGQEAATHLLYGQDGAVNISTAAEDHFSPATVSDASLRKLAEQYGLTRPFVMYTGGIDYRKNIEGLIAAYAELPMALRKEHQLAIVCSVQSAERERLSSIAQKAGLTKGELILTGFMPDEDLLACYQACKLFVFPSWHEGFGLPALEAMQCGKAVIASNVSSLPEVVGRPDALFDPYDKYVLRKKIEHVLTDDTFRADLEKHGLKQSKLFSWDSSARRAWSAMEKLAMNKADLVREETEPARPRLAYISPLPPEPSGISDYSAELIPVLAGHYHIEIIVAQEEVDTHWFRDDHSIRSVAWFYENAHTFDRVLYHFGNSHFHSHMFEMLRAYPGVVVLHDFFLSGIVSHRELSGEAPHVWSRALVEDHGWKALASRFQVQDVTETVYSFPCNLGVIQDALGIIVHADYSRQLARDWYGSQASDDWCLVPLLRQPAPNSDRSAAREALGFTDDELVVCSFGFLAPTKLNHRLLESWLASPLAQDPKCHLVFVGQNHGGEYGSILMSEIRRSSASERIKITGWTDMTEYQKWLAAADVGVQLRTLSRGETSAAVLDCMNHGLATIVNANGSMAELPNDAVYMLPDSFDNSQLVDALTTLWGEPDRRVALAQRAVEAIAERHDPIQCAGQYFQAIENFYRRSVYGVHGLVAALRPLKSSMADAEWQRVASAISHNAPPVPRRKQLLMDVSQLVQRDCGSDIETTLRSLLRCCLLSPPSGWALEPVYASIDPAGYRYARKFASELLGVYDGWAEDELVDAWAGDIFIGMDFRPDIVASKEAILCDWHDRGVQVQFLVHKELVAEFNSMEVDNISASSIGWLDLLAKFDAVLCSSEASADLLHKQLAKFETRSAALGVTWIDLKVEAQSSDSGAEVLAKARRLLGMVIGEKLNFNK